MIWTKKKPEVGAIRYVKKFAWIPTWMTSPPETAIWLHTYTEMQQYQEYGWDNRPFAWIIRGRFLSEYHARNRGRDR